MAADYLPHVPCRGQTIPTFAPLAEPPKPSSGGVALIEVAVIEATSLVSRPSCPKSERPAAAPAQTL